MIEVSEIRHICGNRNNKPNGLHATVNGTNLVWFDKRDDNYTGKFCLDCGEKLPLKIVTEAKEIL